jgi:hypothetical protein
MAKSSLTTKETQVFNGVYLALTKGGLSDQTATKYATFAVEIYDQVTKNPQLQMALSTYRGAKEAKGAELAFGYAARASNLGLDASAARFAAKGAEGVGGVMSEFVDYCASFAKSLGIEMNECALAITKVILDVLTTVAMADTVVGVWAAAMQVLSTVSDARSVAQACFG